MTGRLLSGWEYIREFGIPAEINRPFSLFSNAEELKKHPAYQRAKAGDEVAAFELVSDLALEFFLEVAQSLSGGHVFVAPFASEASGDNAIPQVVAALAAEICGGVVDDEIVQVTRVFHTGADPMERLISRPAFEGRVSSGSTYVLVDDVTSMGGTIAELSDYIQRNGGRIHAVLVLVNAGRDKSLVPKPNLIHNLEQRYENEIAELFGIQPGALTANEASYLIGFRTVDELRSRRAKAKEEIYLRLRSKGIQIVEHPAVRGE